MLLGVGDVCDGPEIHATGQQKPRGPGREKQLGSCVQDTIQVSEKNEAVLEAEPVPISCHIQGIGFYIANRDAPNWIKAGQLQLHLGLAFEAQSFGGPGEEGGLEPEVGVDGWEPVWLKKK